MKYIVKLCIVEVVCFFRGWIGTGESMVGDTKPLQDRLESV